MSQPIAAELSPSAGNAKAPGEKEPASLDAPALRPAEVIRQSRALVPVNSKWKADLAVIGRRDGLRCIVVSSLATMPPLWFPVAVGIPLFAMFQTVALALLVLSRTGSLRLQRATRAALGSLGDNEFGSARYQEAFLLGHFVQTAIAALHISEEWTRRVFFDISRAGAGWQMLLLSLISPAVFYATALAHVITTWHAVPAGSSAGEAEELGGIQYAHPEPVQHARRSKLFRSVMGLAVLSGIAFGFSGILHYAYKGLFGTGERPVHLVLSILGGSHIAVSVTFFAQLCGNMMTLLQSHHRAVKAINDELLVLPCLTPATLARWWVRRTEFVHRALPVVYLKVSWLVIIACASGAATTLRTVIPILVSGPTSIVQFDVMLAAMFTPAAAIGVIAFIDAEVGIYHAAQAARHSLDSVLLHLDGLRSLPFGFCLPMQVAPDDVLELREAMERMRSYLEYDPFASVFGIPMKPAFRNIVIGYVTTAVIAVAGRIITG